jgi:hypothetical protein
MYEKEGNKKKAKEHYLEAASIYVLNSELLKDDNLLSKANFCYGKVHGKEIKYSKQELAKRTMEEIEIERINPIAKINEMI